MTEETPTPTARIKRIEVIGLFGLYDHVIELKLEDRVTILHGPNGVGKTVLLQMLRALLSDQLDELAQVPFNTFSVEFTDGKFVKVSATIETIEIPGGKRNRNGFRVVKKMTVSRVDEENSITFQCRKTSPASEMFDAAGIDDAFIRRHAHQFPGTQWVSDNILEIWDFFDKPIQVHLTEAQRILRQLNPGNTRGTSTASPGGFPAVWNDAIDLERRIASLRQKYGAKAQEIDQTFPSRLIHRSGPSIPSRELKSRMSAVENKRLALQNNGILDESSTKPFNVADLDTLSQAQSDVLALYVEDTEDKQEIFTDLLQRVELFARIINARLRNKTVRTDHKHGLVVRDHHGGPLELRALSSGEQQQIIILYDLLFRVKTNTLVLIDEPELSLHVLWQKRFLPDLLEIVQVAGIDAVVATHSPFIVGDRSDLMVALDAEIDHDEPVQS